MLSRSDIDKLSLLLASSGWNDVMRPLIETKLVVAKKMAFLMPSERPAPYKDLSDEDLYKHLRGEVKMLEWVLQWFPSVVNIDRANRRSEELARQQGGTEAGRDNPEAQPSVPIS